MVKVDKTSEVPVSLGRHLFLAAQYGLWLGLAVGHVDLLIRFLAKRIEWFEVYQSLFLPGAVLTIACTLLALIAHVSLRLMGKLPGEKKTHSAYAAFLFAVFFVVAVFPIAHFLLYRDVLIWEPKRGDFNVALFFACLITIVGVQALFQHFRLSLPSSFTSRIRSVWGQYAFFVTIGCLTSLGYDIFLQRVMPEQTRTEKVIAKNSQSRPNIVLITLDTVRAANVSFLGYEKTTTPNLDALAKESAVFEHVEAVTSWTLPSHASLFTGKYSIHHRAHEVHQQLADEQTTLAELLSAAGYRTAGFIGGPYCKGKYGLSQGFQLFQDRLDFFEYRHTYDPLSIKRAIDFVSNDFRRFLLRSDGERKAPEINRDVFRWLERSGGEPFFLFLNYFDAHDPYDQGLEFRKRFTSEQRDDDALNEMVRSYYFDPENRYRTRKVDPEVRDYLIAMYDTEIYFLDRYVQSFINKLKQLGLYENTLLVITSDHGEEFFEHGGVMHKQTLYEEVLHVPLLFHWPDRISPGRFSKRVSLVDVFPTILDFVSENFSDGIDGISLAQRIKAGSEEGLVKRDIFAERYARIEHGESKLRAVYDSDWKYIQVNPEQERMPTALYNLAEDPGETENLRPDEKMREKQMNQVLERFSQEPVSQGAE